MKLTRIAGAAAVALAMAGCDAADFSDGTVAKTASRNVALDNATAAVAQPTIYHAHSLSVVVPDDLEVSEENLLFPKADIVWRGDAPGDRHAQVKAIFEAGMGQGIDEMQQRGKSVDVQVQVLRFHSLTERARYSFGGVHAIEFFLTMVDRTTGEPIERRRVTADLKAFGGSKALAAEAKGLTMKARITDHLAEVIQSELSRLPEV